MGTRIVTLDKGRYYAPVNGGGFYLNQVNNYSSVKNFMQGCLVSAQSLTGLNPNTVRFTGVGETDHRALVDSGSNTLKIYLGDSNWTSTSFRNNNTMVLRAIIDGNMNVILNNDLRHDALHEFGHFILDDMSPPHLVYPATIGCARTGNIYYTSVDQTAVEDYPGVDPLIKC